MKYNQNNKWIMNHLKNYEAYSVKLANKRKSCISFVFLGNLLRQVLSVLPSVFIYIIYKGSRQISQDPFLVNLDKYFSRYLLSLNV